LAKHKKVANEANATGINACKNDIHNISKLKAWSKVRNSHPLGMKEHQQK
jgi:hypothetical protein